MTKSWLVLILYPHPQPFTIGDKLYGTMLVGAVDIFLTYFLFQPVNYLIAGVTKGVTFPNEMTASWGLTTVRNSAVVDVAEP